MAEAAPGAAAPAAVPPPVVPPVAGDPGKGAWPPAEEQLEKWMMNTVKEGDAGAKFLRTMLLMNPAYGTYLQTDPDLVDVVQMFAKRIKTKISQFDTPANMPPQTLTQPLCEMIWRVVGLIMHSVIELEDEANMPVPKEASGMIRMLLHTNTQLSTKLNELRRVYLKELSVYRDKERRVSAVAARAIAGLVEQPIMFYEPLEFVLDDTTKDFVRETVVERLKLEMRNAFQSNDDNSEVTAYIEDLEKQIDLLKAEVKTCRATSNRLEEQMKTLTEKEQKQREDLKGLREETAEQKKTMAEQEKEIARLKQDIVNRDRKIAHLEAKLGEAPTEVAAVEQSVQYEDHTEEVEALRARNMALEAENKKQADEIEKLTKELAALRGKGPQVVQGDERIVYQDDPETKRLLEQALQVERELRAANESLQKALEESEAECAALRKELGKKPVAPKEVAQVAKAPKNTKDKGPTAEEMAAMKDAEHEKAMNKLKKAHDAKIQEMQDMIDKLQKKLDDALEKLQDALAELDASGKTPKTKVVKQIGIPEEEHTKLKVRIYELEQQLEKMQDEHALLEQKIQMLMDKLREKFSDAELGEILEKINLAPPPLRKRRKKKAYERLYDDAQRRILEMKMRQEKLKQLEERSIRNMARMVAGSSRDRGKVEMLNHLHQANQHTSKRFHDALYSFHMAREGEGMRSGLEGDEYEFEEEARRIDRLTDLEEMTIQCFKDGVCPRCAFAAMSVFSLGRKPPSPQQMGHGLTYSGGRSPKEPLWDPVAAITGGSPANRGRMQPPPWDMAGRPGSQGSSGSPTNRTLSPLGAGPSPGPMPFDTAFPMPAPPWRPPPVETSTPSAEGAPPWRQQLDRPSSGGNPGASSSSAPFLRLTTSSTNMGGPGGPNNVSSGGMEGALQGRPLEASGSSMKGGFVVDNDVPPWRRERSDSPVNRRSPSPKMAPNLLGPAQPPSGMPPGPPLQNRGIMPTPLNGRIGGLPGPNWQAPVPGRVPAAQTMALDPIVRPMGQPSGSSKGSRSPSPTAGGTKVQSDGFRKMRAAPTDNGAQFEVEGLGRPSSVPQYNKRADDGGQQVRLGGGGHGSQYKNVSGTQLPTMPSSRSTPNMPVAGNLASMPWHNRGGEAGDANSSVPAQKPGTKATKRGPGFVVTPLMSQERLASSTASGPSPPNEIK